MALGRYVAQRLAVLVPTLFVIVTIAFFLIRVAFDGKDRPVETCEHIMSGDRWQLSYAWAAD